MVCGVSAPEAASVVKQALSEGAAFVGTWERSIAEHTYEGMMAEGVLVNLGNACLEAPAASPLPWPSPPPPSPFPLPPSPSPPPPSPSSPPPSPSPPSVTGLSVTPSLIRVCVASGWVVHGLEVLEYSDGLRTGVFLENNGSPLPLWDNAALQRRGRVWHTVLPGEQLVSISSRPSKLKSSPKYLCGEIFLRLSSGRTIESTGDYGRASGVHFMHMAAGSGPQKPTFTNGCFTGLRSVGRDTTTRRQPAGQFNAALYRSPTNLAALLFSPSSAPPCCCSPTPPIVFPKYQSNTYDLVTIVSRFST